MTQRPDTPTTSTTIKFLITFAKSGTSKRYGLLFFTSFLMAFGGCPTGTEPTKMEEVQNPAANPAASAGAVPDEEVLGERAGILMSPNQGTADGGTLVTIQSMRGGFNEQTSVIFGQNSGLEIHVINEHVLTVVTPPGDAGTVPVYIDMLGFIEWPYPNPRVRLPQFEYYIVPPDDGTDKDGDGLTNTEEETGWTVWIEVYGLQMGVDTFGNVVAQYAVTSDPKKIDTDGDGLSDYEERLFKSDPRKVDSDEDGLWDGEEVHRWHTSPTSVDTDADARGSRDLQNAPNPALFDGRELFDEAMLKLPPDDPARIVKPRATSPTLADTDGDGVSDFDELGSTVRNGVLADLPLLNYELVGDVDVRLNVEYAESIGQTNEYGVTLTESRSETVASEFSSTIGWSVEVGVEFGYAGLSPHVLGHVDVGVHGEYTSTYSTESSRESSKEVSRLQSDSREFTETAADGTIRTAILLKNGGNTTFTVNGLGVLVSQREKKKALGEVSPPQRKTIATMTPVFDSITLAPGETAGPFELAATGVNAQSIKELLAAPDALMLGTAAMNFTDSAGLDFDFVRQFTMARTAYLVIDFGDGEVRQYNVATNVDRNPDSTYRGITLKRVLEDVLGLPYGDPSRGYTTMENPGSANNLQVLESLLGRRYAERGVGRDTWALVTSNPAHSTSDFNSIVLRAGDYVHLMFSRDDDGDGLSNTLEKAAGTDQIPNAASSDDADGDGLTDYFEVVTGWVAFAAPADSGIQWASFVQASSVREGHSTANAAGAPDTDEYGDFTTTWAPGPQNGSQEWITANFLTPVYASGATIRETWGNGFVYQVDVVDTNDSLHTVWRGTDPSQPGAPVDYVVTWPRTDYLVKGIKIYVDTDANPDTWEEIDAVALHGFSDPRARRVFSDPRFSDADDDGLTDAQEFAARSDPLDPDTDGDSLLDGQDPFPTIPAAILYVKADAAAGGDGHSWMTAYRTIQEALAAAAAGQATPNNPNDDVAQLWVASGVYKPDSRSSPITLLNKVGIYGGFSGPTTGFTGETKRGQRNTNAFTNGCVLSGDRAGDDTGTIDLNMPGTYNENCPVVVSAPASIDSSALLDGFMITGAYLQVADADGGALSLLGSPTIQNCLITRNGNQKSGAGVRAAGSSSAVFKKCILAGNVAVRGGGAYLGSSGRIKFEDCEFSQNVATRLGTNDDWSSSGGGVCISTNLGGVDFNRCVFTGNSAWCLGGGLYAIGNSLYLRVDSCRFYSNAVTTTGWLGDWRGCGGGIAVDTNASISNSVFWDNRSKQIGGAVSVISGAGIPNANGWWNGPIRRCTITNCTIASNRAWVAGGNSSGGGVAAAGNKSNVLIQNTVAWDNWYGADSLPDNPDYQEHYQIYDWDGQSTWAVSNTCLNAGWPYRWRAVNGNINDDPTLENLELGDLRLGENSPCIDRGGTFVDLDPQLPGFQKLPSLDLAGQPRIVDGNSDGVVAVDIGAFEAAPAKH